MITLATMADRVAEYGFRSTWKPATRNRLMDPDGSQMDHYRVTLTAGGKRMVLTYSKGSGLKGEPPTTEEVLSCLAQDAAGFDNAGSFGEWVREYGGDPDSRIEEQTYRAIGRQRDSLYRLCAAVGPCVFNNLLYHTDPA